MVIQRLRDFFCKPIRFDKSLQLRLLLPLTATILIVVILLPAYSLKKLEEASTFQLHHEALLLSDALKAAIMPALYGEPDVPEIQSHIDRLVSTRKRNDIEINVMFLQGNRSNIVASNIPDNIEKTDVYEHRAVLAVLGSGEPSFFIGMDRGEPSEPVYPPSHPDHYVGPGKRFISVTSPLFVHGRGLGAINTKLSLFEIDRKIGAIRRRVLLAVIAVPLFLLLLIRWIVRRGLSPLNRIARKTGELGEENLGYRFPLEGLPKELRPICARLNDLFSRLEAAFERERRFSANVAHELRTPITELRALCEVWLDFGDEKERDTEKILRDALEIAEQMEHVVDTLLNLVHFESGHTEPKLENINLVQSIQEAWKPFGERVREKSLSIRLDLPESLSLKTDQDLLKAILSNLFANAVTYAPRNGSIRCVLASENGMFQLDVENSVAGLTESDLKHLPEPFWRSDPARTAGPHSGLGLSLVTTYSRVLNLALKIELPKPDWLRVRLHGLIS